MTDEPSTKTKTDVLDLIISFLMEHEQQLDQTLQRLEKLVERLSERSDRLDPEPPRRTSPRPQPGAFTLTISNPGSFEEMKSLKIEWRANPDASERSRVIGEIERAIGKD